MRQQSVDVAIGGGGQSREHVGEPGEWLAAVGLCGGQQAHDGRSSFACGFGAGEQPVFAVMRGYA